MAALPVQKELPQKFLLGNGNLIPWPAPLKHNHERLVLELEALAKNAGLPIVRSKGAESEEDSVPAYQDAALVADRPEVVAIGKAQERTSAWRGFVDESHPGYQFGVRDASSDRFPAHGTRLGRQRP